MLGVASLARERRPWIAVGLAGCVLIVGALLVPQTYGQPTRELWLVIVVVLISAGLALARPPMRVLAFALMILVVVDGVRESGDYLKEGGSTWQSSPAQLAYFYQRDEVVRALPITLARVPAARPARVPGSPIAQVNSAGWLADAYHLTDYNPIRERSLVKAEKNPEWLKMLLAPWFAAAFPCATVGCTNATVHLPPPSTWHASSSVRTLSYGADKIVYAVRVSQPTLMVENELAIAGWHANTGRVSSVKTATPLRAWRLSPGDYEFAASFAEPGRTLQELAAALALAAWFAGIFLLLRSRRR